MRSPPDSSFLPTAAGTLLTAQGGRRWAGEEDPRLVIKSLTCRPKNRAHSQTRTCVGDFGPGLKGWDFGKGTRREIFDGDIPYQLEAQEMLLDWVFDRLSITGGSGTTTAAR